MSLWLRLSSFCQLYSSASLKSRSVTNIDSITSSLFLSEMNVVALKKQLYQFQRTTHDSVKVSKDGDINEYGSARYKWGIFLYFQIRTEVGLDRQDREYSIEKNMFDQRAGHVGRLSIDAMLFLIIFSVMGHDYPWR